MKITKEKVMNGWYKILVDGVVVGQASNFQGFWSGEVQYGYLRKPAGVTSNTLKGIIPKIIEVHNNKGGL